MSCIKAAESLVCSGFTVNGPGLMVWCLVLCTAYSAFSDEAFSPPTRFSVGKKSPIPMHVGCGMMGFSDISQDDEWRIEVAIFPSGQAFREQWLPSAGEDRYRLVWRAKTSDCVEVFGRVYQVVEGTGGVSFGLLTDDAILPRVATDPTAYVVPFRGHAGLHDHVLGARPAKPGDDGKPRVAVEIAPQGKRLKMSQGEDHPEDAILVAEGDEFEIADDATPPATHRYRVSGIVAPEPESRVLGWIHVHAVVPPKTGP